MDASANVALAMEGGKEALDDLAREMLARGQAVELARMLESAETSNKEKMRAVEPPTLRFTNPASRRHDPDQQYARPDPTKGKAK